LYAARKGGAMNIQRPKVGKIDWQIIKVVMHRASRRPNGDSLSWRIIDELVSKLEKVHGKDITVEDVCLALSNLIRIAGDLKVELTEEVANPQMTQLVLSRLSQ